MLCTPARSMVTKLMRGVYYSDSDRPQLHLRRRGHACHLRCWRRWKTLGWGRRPRLQRQCRRSPPGWLRRTSACWYRTPAQSRRCRCTWKKVSHAVGSALLELLQSTVGRHSACLSNSVHENLQTFADYDGMLQYCNHNSCDTMPTRRLDLVLFFGNKWSQMVSNPR